MERVIDLIRLTFRSYLFFLFMAFISCNNNVKNNSPLAIVVKLNSAEELEDFNEARNYIDVHKVYGKYAKKGVTSEQCWRDFVNFNNELKKDKKFTNQLKYFNYDIEEVIDKDSAIVILKAKDVKTKVKIIKYKLSLKSGNWVVQEILYNKFY